MVLENLSSLKKAQKHPIYLFFIAFALTILAVVSAYYTFPASSSVLSISFVSLALMPIIYSLFAKEEAEIATDQSALNLFSQNFGVIHIYSWMFLGMMCAYVAMGAVFPESHDNCQGLACSLPEKKTVFSEQLNIYSGITGKVIGENECFSQKTRKFDACFELIFKNNMWVMVMSLLFSLIWGAGALFLLGWNASVIGLFISTEITSKSLGAGLARAISYLPHGIPEVIAYFIGAIAGGIISAAISKTKFRPHEIRTVLIDAALLTILATVTLVLAGIIEASAIFGYNDLALAALLAFAGLYVALYVPSIRHNFEKFRMQKKPKGQEAKAVV